MTKNEAKVAELLRRYCPEGAVLDVPCGTGGLCRHLRTQGYEVVPADLNPSLLQLPDLDCRRADLDGALPFEDESFDAVCCVAGLEHTENPRHVLREFRRVVRPGGWVIVQVPNFSSFKRRVRFLFRGRVTRDAPREVRQDEQKHHRGHISCLPATWFRQQCMHALLEVVHCEFYHRHRRTALFGLPFWGLLCLHSGLKAKLMGEPDLAEATNRDVLLNREVVIVSRKGGGPAA